MTNLVFFIVGSASRATAVAIRHALSESFSLFSMEIWENLGI